MTETHPPCPHCGAAWLPYDHEPNCLTRQETKPKKKERKPPKLTQSERWAALCAAASDALSSIEGNLDALESAMSDLTEMRDEYGEKRDNMPENLANSAYGEKLNAVADLDLEDAAQPLRDAVDELRGKIEEAEGTDLPLGFGRD